MDKISNTIISLLENLSDVWVVEWHFDDQGKKYFNVTTLDKSIQHTYNCWRESKPPQYHLLGFAASIDEAHEMIDLFKKSPGGNNVYPFKKP